MEVARTLAVYEQEADTEDSCIDNCMTNPTWQQTIAFNRKPSPPNAPYRNAQGAKVGHWGIIAKILGKNDDMVSHESGTRCN